MVAPTHSAPLRVRTPHLPLRLLPPHHSSIIQLSLPRQTPPDWSRFHTHIDAMHDRVQRSVFPQVVFIRRPSPLLKSPSVDSESSDPSGHHSSGAVISQIPALHRLSKTASVDSSESSDVAPNQSLGVVATSSTGPPVVICRRFTKSPSIDSESSDPAVILPGHHIVTPRLSKTPSVDSESSDILPPRFIAPRRLNKSASVDSESLEIQPGAASQRGVCRRRQQLTSRRFQEAAAFWSVVLNILQTYLYIAIRLQTAQSQWQNKVALWFPSPPCQVIWSD